MAEQYKKPYLESSVFIALIKGESIPQMDSTGKMIGHEERANIGKHILTLAEAGQFPVYTSSITIAEVHKNKLDLEPGSEPESNIIDFFRNRHFKIIDVDRSIAESAHRLCRKLGLKAYDAVHLACALRAGCDALLTWDSDLLKITDSGIGISKPQAIGQSVLDLAPEQEEVPLSGVNYFFALTTTISPYQRQLLPSSSAERSDRRRPGCFGWEKDRIRGGGKVGNLVLVFHFSIRLVAGAVGMWESRRFLVRFPRGSWKGWKARLWLSSLYTDPPFPQLSFCRF